MVDHREFSYPQTPPRNSKTSFESLGGLLNPAQQLANNSLDQALTTLESVVNEPWQHVNWIKIPINIGAAFTSQLVGIGGTNIMVASSTVTLPAGWYISIATDSPENGPVDRGLGNQINGDKFTQFYLTLAPANAVSGGVVNLVVWKDTPSRRVELR